MNRRQFGLLALGATAIPAAAQSLGRSCAPDCGSSQQSGATAVIAQTGVVTLGPTLNGLPEIPLAERKRQFAICAERGHSPAPPIVVASNYAQGPPWETCKFCGTLYRFVTTMEEENKP